MIRKVSDTISTNFSPYAAINAGISITGTHAAQNNNEKRIAVPKKRVFLT